MSSNIIGEGVAPQARPPAYASAALAAETTNVATALEGTRNDTLNKAAFNLSRFITTGELDEMQIRDSLTTAARTAGLGHTEIIATLNSALSSRTVVMNTVVDHNADNGPSSNMDEGWDEFLNPPKRRTWEDFLDRPRQPRITSGAAASNATPSPAPTSTVPGRQARIEWASNIRPERQIWLWENRIPAGTVSALAGRGGTGKTTYALHLAAQLSRGTLPGQHYGNPRPTLLWSGEDAWGPVLVPRAMAAGADMSKIGRLAITTTVSDGETTPLLPLDAEPFRDAITTSGAALVIIDPIASTMSGDLHREADVRAAIDSLARVAADTGAVIMFVRHFGKGAGNASDKMSGSHAFRDAVRSVFLFAQDDDRVVISQDKGNYAPPGAESFAFRLENSTVTTDDGPVGVARVVDLGVSEDSVGDIINRSTNRDDDDANDVDSWLRDLLANGSVKATEVFSSADAAGHSKDQAKRAKKRLGVIADRPENPGPWFWSLPAERNPLPEAGSIESEAGSTGHSAPPHMLPALPALPVRSEGVQQGSEEGREQGAGECSLPTDRHQEQSLMSTTPTPLDARRQQLDTRRTITFRGQPVPRCAVCGKGVMAGQGDTHLSCASKQRDTA